ncbi:MAG: PDZ domain-containing protein [Acidobacteriota bacterium]
MNASITRIFIAALLATGIAVAAVADDEPKCHGTARECDQQIRHFLGGRRFLGATIKDRNPGLMIESVTPDGPAEAAGLKKGDRLIACNNKSLTTASSREFKQLLADARANGMLYMIVWRRGAYKVIKARLEPYSKEQVDKIIAGHLAESHTSSAGHR